jgi:hypothetical protein
VLGDDARALELATSSDAVWVASSSTTTRACTLSTGRRATPASARKAIEVDRYAAGCPRTAHRGEGERAAAIAGEVVWSRRNWRWAGSCSLETGRTAAMTMRWPR